MNMDGAALNRFQALDGGHPGRSHRIEAGIEEVRKKAKPKAEIEESPVADETEPTEGQETQEARGVLRLLQEGHFKGVADLRLRINFAEERADAELPALSDPKGSGKAYEKFLAIYQGLQGMEETEDVEASDNPDLIEAPENPDPVDVVA